MAPKPFKPPGPSTAKSNSFSSPSVTIKKKPPDRSKDNTDTPKQKKNLNSSRTVSGPSSSAATLIRGRNKVSNVSTVNKRRKIVDRRASSMSTIKLPSLSPSTSDQDENNENLRSVVDSQAEEGTSSSQEDEVMRNLEVDESMDDNDDDIEDDDDPFGTDSNLPRRSRNYSARQLGSKNGEDEDDEDQILANIDNNIDIDEDEDEEDASATRNSEKQDIFIPRDLLSVLLHEMFKSSEDTHDTEREESKGTTKRGQIRITKQAVDAVGKYLDTFVKEAVARAACEDLERGGSGVLEVEDLERLAPQLILDF